MNLHRRRKWVNRIALTLSMLAMLFGLVWLIWILYTVLSLGAAGLSWATFTEMTPPPGAEKGGLLNAIVGSIELVVLATLIGTPLGVMTGIYLAEFARKSFMGQTLRFINDLLLSAPSIVLGLFIYTIVVVKTGGYSGWAGVLALALLLLPVVVRTTDNMLQLVPNALREAAFALGASQRVVIWRVTLRAARTGVLTGVLLALARISGETAPLLFTATSNQFWNTDLSKPVANLPVTIFRFAMTPFEDWQRLAWAAVFLITLGVLLINLLSRTLLRSEKIN